MESLVIIIAVFGLVGSSVFFLLAPKGRGQQQIVQGRLDAMVRGGRAVSRAPSDTPQTLWESIAEFFLGSRELAPKYSSVRRLLYQAGYSDDRAVLKFWGIRFFLAIVFAAGAFFFAIINDKAMLVVFIFVGTGALLGYGLPLYFVRKKANRRKLDLQDSLPDTLDLLVVCTEAGMGIEQAFVRVGQEQADAGFDIGHEFQILSREIQAGVSRREALARMVERMDIDDFRNLVAFVNQSEEFGGSIARSLRVYAATMRDKRSQKAEETARKMVIKLLFPLVMFILPAMFLIVLSPVILHIGDVLTRATS